MLNRVIGICCVLAVISWPNAQAQSEFLRVFVLDKIAVFAGNGVEAVACRRNSSLSFCKSLDALPEENSERDQWCRRNYLRYWWVLMSDLRENSPLQALVS